MPHGYVSSICDNGYEADFRWLPNESLLRFVCFRRVFSQNREGHFCELCLVLFAQSTIAHASQNFSGMHDAHFASIARKLARHVHQAAEIAA